MELNSNRHSVYRLQFHLVVVTKYRHKVIDKEINARLKEIVLRVFEHCWGLKIIEMETEADHIHILFESNPKTDLSKLINNFKTVSSRLLRKEFKEKLAKFYTIPTLWSNSYCILSVGGASIETIRGYIENQDAPQN